MTSDHQLPNCDKRASLIIIHLVLKPGIDQQAHQAFDRCNQIPRSWERDTNISSGLVRVHLYLQHAIHGCRIVTPKAGFGAVCLRALQE